MTRLVQNTSRLWRGRMILWSSAALVAGFWQCPGAAAADSQSVRPQPNYEQAQKYSGDYLREFVYDTSVTPHWVGKTDVFWYSYRTSSGTSWYRVNSKFGIKEPLFDCAKLGAQLSELAQKPLDCAQLPLQRASINDEGTKLKFVVEDYQYEYDLQAEKLTKLGKAPPAPAFGGRGGRGQLGGRRGNFQRLDNQQFQQQDDQQTGRGGTGVQAGRGTRGGDYRNFSPDRTLYVFAKKYNLYLVDLKQREQREKADAGFDSNEDDIYASRIQDARNTPAAKHDPDDDAIQLTTDGAEDYSFLGGFGRGGRGGGNGEQQAQSPPPDRKTRPNVIWSKDSKSFYVVRIDSRGVQELWVINSLSQPRPTLEKYRYPMPGEDAVPKSELFIFDRDAAKLSRVKPKWIDEGYGDIDFGKTGDELRFIRHDRLLRHDEFCSLTVHSGDVKCLISEGFENANLATQNVTYVEATDEMIWWSERSGWGHFYLYDRDGKLKNEITSGPFRASRIVDIDAKNRILYFVGNAREPGENVYYEHIYRVHFDGTDLVLMDPGNSTHSSLLSQSREYLVDNYSRVDMRPTSVLRDAGGKQIMELERADLSQLEAVGWKMPETFVVKAADGVTDLYGNLWKPFDFDPHRKYPIIAHVYPGPQMEGTTYTFSAVAPEQQLAQIGFIVIQVGHRGGSPQRSKAYGSYGYFNLRDYGLADKKAAIEQLAARFSFIDLDRVGIYGHSGGGFMTAAAMLQKPYNEFFRVGVAESGNHDNNIYNQGWSERYHGLREVVITDDKNQNAKTGSAQAANQDRQQGNGADQQNDQGAQDDGDAAASADWERTDSLSWLAEAADWQDAGDPELAQAIGNSKSEDKKVDTKTETEQAKKVKFEIHVPTNVELAANLKGHLLLIHGESDNNVHPANTLRLVDALIKANKRFDMLYLPGARHAYGDYTPYTTQRTWEYFAQHLLGDYQPGADILEKAEPPSLAR